MAGLTLAERDSLPARFLELDARDLWQAVPEPTLIHLPGRRPAPVLVSILLHGNEPVGLRAVQTVLARYAGRELPRALSIFVGNVIAARAGVRRLDEQPDYNRVWPGGEFNRTDAPEALLARGVVAAMRAHGVFASIDMHNNTGLNPFYGCVTSRTNANLQLATLFSRTVIYFEQPTGTQVGAFDAVCPAVALECGKPGNPEGEARAAALLDAALHLAQMPIGPVPAHDLDLFHTIGTVRIPPDVTFTFQSDGADLCFDPAIDHYNFRELPAGSRFGRVANAATRPIDVRDAHGHDLTEHYFEIRDGELRTRQPVMPAMLTTDPRAIRQDCLCYLMERPGALSDRNDVHTL